MEHYLNRNTAALGYGTKRLPMYGKSATKMDARQIEFMADRFLEAGFQYFDTGFDFRDGIVEAEVKEALVNRHARESFCLADRLPMWLAGSKVAAEQMLLTSLERTGAGYFDYYLLAELGGENTALCEKYDLWNYLVARKAEGLIRHIGFSFGGTASELEELLTKHPAAEFVQLRINYADWECPEVQSRLCYEVARKFEKPIIAMNPVKGGALSTLPYEVSSPLRDACPTNSLSSWALRFAASLEGVAVVLCDVGNLAQMNDNLDTMRGNPAFSDVERTALSTAQAAFAPKA